MKKIPKWAISFTLGLIVIVLSLAAMFVLKAMELMTIFILIALIFGVGLGVIICLYGVMWED